LRALLGPLGRTVIAVPLRNVLHLKSAVTALPDGTFLLLLPQLVPAGLFPAVRPVAEQGGCHVVPLGEGQVLIAASAPGTAELLGWFKPGDLRTRRCGTYAQEARTRKLVDERARQIARRWGGGHDRR
jgi:hypothetical protein